MDNLEIFLLALRGIEEIITTKKELIKLIGNADKATVKIYLDEIEAYKKKVAWIEEQTRKIV